MLSVRESLPTYSMKLFTVSTGIYHMLFLLSSKRLLSMPLRRR